MRILLSNKFFYPRGGDCIHTMQLKELLEKNGHEVAVFAMQFPENQEHTYAAYWPSEVSFVKKSPQKILASLIRPFGVTEVKKKWTKLLNDFRPDIVHLHNIHSQLSPVIGLIAKTKNIPVVWTLHDYKLLCPAYTFRDRSGNVCEDCLQKPETVIRKKCIKGSSFASLLGYLEYKKWNKNLLSSVTSQFIAPSAFIKHKMIAGGFPDNQITHLYNFSGDEKFVNKPVLQRNNTVLYFGRLSQEKGVETLCRAFKRIVGMKLIVIGDGPIKYSLQNEYASTDIEFTGYQPWSVIQEYLSKAAFAVVPSEWYENNPLTILEALALGTPVLGADIGGIPELISENNGMLFQPGNVTSLLQKINEMKEKKWMYETISENAKKRFSMEAFYKKLLYIYNQSIKQKV